LHAQAWLIRKDILGLSSHESAIDVYLEYGVLRWRSSDGAERGIKGNIGLGQAHIHSDVRTLKKEKTPVLEIVGPKAQHTLLFQSLKANEKLDTSSDKEEKSIYKQTSSSSSKNTAADKPKPIVCILKTESLDTMQELWVAILQSQQLLRKLDIELGVEEDEEDAQDYDEMDDPNALTPRRAGANEKRANLSQGMFEPKVFLAIRRAYEQVLGLVIRPPRAKYTIDKLGPRRFTFGGNTIVRDDFSILNNRGLRVRCSLWRPGAPLAGYAFTGEIGAGAEDTLAGTFPSLFFNGVKAQTDNNQQEDVGLPPVIIYLHGNASCRLEALSALSLCLGLGCAVCAIDCAGSGQSDGEFVSLGYYEADDVVAVVDYLKSQYAMTKYALWGRSMGAVTSLLFVSEKAPDAACVIADSPFASIKRLCYDLVHKAAKRVPDGATLLAVRKIRRSVKYRAGFDIYKCNPQLHVNAAAPPGLIIHGRDDDFILPTHTDAIAKAYGGKVQVSKPPGNHNAKRPTDVFLQIQDIIKTNLVATPDAQDKTPRSAMSPIEFDFSNFQHPGVPNPFLLPPWFYHIKSIKGTIAILEPNPLYFSESADASKHASKKKRSHKHTHPPHGANDPHPSPGDEEFISGMSEERQQETEAAVGNLFGASSSKK